MSSDTSEGVPKPEEPRVYILPGDEDTECNRTFVFNNEGHTLGNALKTIISLYPTVKYCGYVVPHPSETKMNFRIQTNGPAAVEILHQGLKDLTVLCDHTLTLFKEEVKNVRKS